MEVSRKRRLSKSGSSASRPRAKQQRVNDEDDEGSEPASQASEASKRPEVAEMAAAAAAEEELEEEEEEGEAYAAAMDDAASSDASVDDVHESEVGIVEEVHMENFMCHRNLTVTLGAHFNVVTGKNGSGKSAILAALQICLGGSTLATGRAGKMAEMVTKHSGAQYAIVRVKLRNQGEDAHDFDTYGNSIYIERKILARGGGTWRVLNERKQCKSTKKREITIICDKFNLAPANPIVVLTQDNAKLFLQSDGAAQYKFFLSATDLDKIVATLDSAKEELHQCGLDIEEKKKRLPLLEKKQKAAELIWENAKEVGKLAANLADAKSMEYWSKIIDVRAQRDAKIEAKESVGHAITKGGVKLAGYEEKLKCNQTLRQNQGDKVKQLHSSMRDFTTNQGEMKKQAAAANKTVKVATRALKEAAKARVEAESNVSKAEKEITKTRRDAAKAKRERLRKAAKQTETPEAKALRLANAELEDIEEEITDQRATLKEHEPARAAAEGAMIAAEARLDDANDAENDGGRALDDLQRKIEEAQDRVDEASAPVGSAAASSAVRMDPRLRACSGEVQKLWKAIHAPQNARRFRQLPKGPIAAHIKMKPDCGVWATAAERCIGFMTMNAFLVNDAGDRQALKQLVAELRLRSSVKIVTSKFYGHAHTLPAGKIPAKKHTTVLDTLECDDVDLMNMLIDQRSIERKLVVRKLDAEKTMFGTGARARSPQNAIEALDEVATIYKLFSGARSIDSYEKAALKPQFLFSRAAAGGGRSGGGRSLDVDDASARRLSPRELETLKTQADSWREQHKKLTREKAKHTAQVKSLVRELNAAKKKHTQAMRAEAKLESSIIRLENQREELKAKQSRAKRVHTQAKMKSGGAVDAEDEAESEANAAIAVLEGDLEESRAFVEECNDRVTEAEMALSAATAEREPIAEKMKEHSTKLEQFYDEKKQITDATLKLEEKIAKIKKKITGKASDIEGARVKLEEIDGEISAHDQIVSKLTGPIAIAKYGVEPAGVTADTVRYERKIIQIEARIETEKKRIGVPDLAAAREDYERTSEEVRQVNDRLTKHKIDKDLLGKALKKREKKWKRMRQEVGKRVSAKFQAKMMKTEKAGSVKFVHAKDGSGGGTLKMKTMMNASAATQSSQGGAATQAHVSTDTAELSGGERSYTTLVSARTLSLSLSLLFLLISPRSCRALCSPSFLPPPPSVPRADASARDRGVRRDAVPCDG